MAKHIKDKDKADLISKKIGDQFQELTKTVQGITYKKLFENSNASISKWKSKQYSAMNGLKKEIATITQTEGKKLVKEIKNASSELELTPKQTKGLVNQVTGGLNYLNRAVIQTYQKDVNKVASNVRNIHSEASDTLYKEIQKQIYKSNRTGVIYSVPTKDGNYKYRQWKWENYMEMKTRTDIQHEITENMIAAGDESGVVFYICSFLGDCAKDHVDYQGKIYCSDNWESFAPKDRIEEIDAYIRAHGIMSVKQVTENDPWLTTRPNCRHYFQYISIDEVLGIKNNKDLNNKRNEMNLNFNGKYQPDKYEALQQQRANERAIRETKSQIDILKMSIDNAPATINKSELLSMNANLANLNYQLRTRQKAQRELIKKYDNLERRYDREKPGAMVSDMRGIQTNLTNKSNDGKIKMDAGLLCDHKDFYVEPLEEKEFLKLKKEFEKKGGIFAQDDEAQRYLKSKNADAITLDSTTIVLKPNPTASEVHEELIHAEQKASGRGNDPFNHKERLECEIEAAKILIANKEKFMISDVEHEYNKKRLEQELKDYEEGNYDKY